MAGRPLRPATDRRLGRPLPHQLANQPSANPIARGPKVPRFHPWIVCGINPAFAGLSPTTGHVPMYYSPVRHSPPGASTRAAVRLACVRHAASVQSEPGSNSSVQTCYCFRFRRTGRSLKADRYMNLFINLTYFSVRLLILLLSDSKTGSLPSSAHTYRLLIFKEHSAQDLVFAALRFQQQRSEIMNPVSQLVNNFFTAAS